MFALSGFAPSTFLNMPPMRIRLSGINCLKCCGVAAEQTRLKYKWKADTKGVNCHGESPSLPGHAVLEWVGGMDVLCKARKSEH